MLRANGGGYLGASAPWAKTSWKPRLSCWSRAASSAAMALAWSGWSSLRRVLRPPVWPVSRSSSQPPSRSGWSWRRTKRGASRPSGRCCSSRRMGAHCTVAGAPAGRGRMLAVPPIAALPMRNLDFSSWNGLLSTLLGLVLVSLVAVGIRLVVMQAIQRRQQRENRQINERLKTLIAAYKTLGGSFTGDLRVDPVHLRELRRRAAEAGEALDEAASDRPRRMRDAVEAALSDIVLLGTEEQVRLAAQAASDMVAGRPVQTAALVVSLRDFIRAAMDLEQVLGGVGSPEQGPLPIAGGSGGKGGSKGEGKGDGGQTGGKGGGGMGGAGGMGAGMGMGMGHHGGDDGH